MRSPVVHNGRILAVEDEPAICCLFRRVLTEEGFEMDIALNGRVAQSMISKQEYCLYLIDLKMPVMGGKELYKWLQDKYPHSAGRVVFTTGSMVGQDTESFLQRSGKPVLLKPFTPGELRAIVRETLEKVE